MTVEPWIEGLWAPLKREAEKLETTSDATARSEGTPVENGSDDHVTRDASNDRLTVTESDIGICGEPGAVMNGELTPTGKDDEGQGNDEGNATDAKKLTEDVSNYVHSGKRNAESNRENEPNQHTVNNPEQDASGKKETRKENGGTQPANKTEEKPRNAEREMTSFADDAKVQTAALSSQEREQDVLASGVTARREKHPATPVENGADAHTTEGAESLTRSHPPLSDAALNLPVLPPAFISVTFHPKMSLVSELNVESTHSMHTSFSTSWIAGAGLWHSGEGFAGHQRPWPAEDHGSPTKGLKDLGL